MSANKLKTMLKHMSYNTIEKPTSLYSTAAPVCDTRKAH